MTFMRILVVEALVDNSLSSVGAHYVKFESGLPLQHFWSANLGQCFGSVWGSVGIFRPRKSLIVLNYMNLRERIARSSF